MLKRFLLLFLTFLLLVGCEGQTKLQQDPNADSAAILDQGSDIRIDPNELQNIQEIFVKFKAATDLEMQRESLQAAGLATVRSYSLLPGLLLTKPKADKSIAEAINILLKNSSVVYAEPNYAVAMAASNYDANALEQPSSVFVRNKISSRVNLNEEVIIAVLDTGTDYIHKDLIDSLWVNRREIPLNGIDDDNNGWIDDIYGWNFVENNNNPKDNNNHGTHVAGIIAGKSSFDNPLQEYSHANRIMSLKVLDFSGKGRVSSVIAAMEYAVRNNADIINFSWTTESYSLALADAMQQSALSQSLIISSAGNRSQNVDELATYPASFNNTNMLVVTSLDASDNLSSFSNYGISSVDLAMPGEYINSTVLNNEYLELSGTSVSAAIVSNLAGIIKSNLLSSNPADIKQIIARSVASTSSIENTVAMGGKIEIAELAKNLALVNSDGTIAVPEVTNNLDSIVVIMSDVSSVAMGASIQLSASGGVEPYHWLIDNPMFAAIDESGVFSALTVGLANVTAVDSNGIASAPYTIRIIPMQILPAELTEILLNQSTNLVADGGLGPYEWRISDETIATGIAGGLQNREFSLSPLKSGNITVSVMDAAGNTAFTNELRIVVPVFSVSPQALNMAIGDVMQLQVTGGTSPYSFGVTGNDIISIDNTGTINAKNIGDVIISIFDATGQLLTVPVTVTIRLTVNLNNYIIPINGSSQATVLGSTGLLSWSSADTAVVTVDNSGLISGVGPGVTTISVSDEAGLNGFTEIEVREVSIQNAPAILGLGSSSLALIAVGGAEPYQWSVSDTNIASVSNTGLLTSISEGDVTVSVVDVDGFSAASNVTVKLLPLESDTQTVLLGSGEKRQIVASGGNGQYSWASSNESVASVDQTGLGSSGQAGQATITLSDGLGSLIEILVEVRQISISTGGAVIQVGGSSVALQAAGGQAPYTWSASNNTIATVDSNGILTPLKAGTLVITVTDADSFSGTLSIAVLGTPMSISPVSALLAVGNTLSFSVSGGDNNYSWTSSNATVASVENNGLVTALQAGTTNITATDGVNSAISATLEVRTVNLNASSTQIALDSGVLQINASGGVEPYAWSLSNTSIATLDTLGRLTPLTTGSVVVTARDADGFSGQISITINNSSLRLDKSSLILASGSSASLQASGGSTTYSWSSSNTAVATVNSSGVVSGIAPGTASITVNDGQGQVVTASVEIRRVNITSSNTTLTVGEPAIQLDVTGGASPYSWSSSNSSIATVNSSGQVTAKAAGNVTITVTDTDGISGSITLSISAPPALVLNRSAALLAINDTVQLSASGGDGNYQWSTSNSSVVTVNSSGLVTARAAGAATITVTDGYGQTQSAAIEVRQVTLSASATSITVGDPALQISASGGNGPYSWSSSSTAIATVNSSGALTPVAAGTVTITARDSDGFSGTISITVNAATVGGGGGGM